MFFPHIIAAYMEQRLSKRVAASGVASRRKAEELIFEGRVKVNGRVVLKPETRVLPTDQVTVDGEGVKSESKVYFILNKPRGTICSAASPKSVLNLFPGTKRLFTIGRLDRDTEGLLLVTNDGDFANQVIHPSSNVHKEYVAKTDHEITHEHLVKINKGRWVEGTYVKPVRVEKMRRGTVKVVVSEGKKREVRLLIEGAGLRVLELKRTRIGGLQLGNLPVGHYRPMKESEKEMVLLSCRKKRSPSKP